jgi:hypothetical protein
MKKIVALLFLLLAASTLTTQAAQQESSVCDAAYSIDLQIPTLIYSRLVPITGEETINGQRLTVKSSLTCNLTVEADNRVTSECFGSNLKTQKRIKATSAQARALIDAFHLANVPEDRTDGGTIHYSLQSIQCTKNNGCSAMVEPPCLP